MVLTTFSLFAVLTNCIQSLLGIELMHNCFGIFTANSHRTVDHIEPKMRMLGYELKMFLTYNFFYDITYPYVIVSI